MKIDRLIGILSVLLQQEKVTAPQLATKFEVSRRTIQRDIESLCRADIPIAAAQGTGGGISIMENYRVDRTVLTAPEMQAILAGLRSLDSVSGTRRYAQLMEKLSILNRYFHLLTVYLLHDRPGLYGVPPKRLFQPFVLRHTVNFLHSGGIHNHLLTASVIFISCTLMIVSFLHFGQ